MSNGPSAAATRLCFNILCFEVVITSISFGSFEIVALGTLFDDNVHHHPIRIPPDHIDVRNSIAGEELLVIIDGLTPMEVIRGFRYRSEEGDEIWRARGRPFNESVNQMLRLVYRQPRSQACSLPNLGRGSWR